MKASSRRTFVDATTLDRRVAEVRVVDPHHPLYGDCFPVSERRSGRGLALIVIRLPDGRERAISRAAIAVSPASENLTAAASRLGRISVRTAEPNRSSACPRRVRPIVAAIILPTEAHLAVVDGQQATPQLIYRSLRARPRNPRDKPKVEHAALIVERWMLGGLGLRDLP